MASTTGPSSPPATLPCVGVTAWNAVTSGRALTPDDTVLVLGSGGLSLFALQFAKRAGARVIATTSSDDKADRLRDLGADETIHRETLPEWWHTVRTATEGRGVDLVVDVAGLLADETLEPVDPGALFRSSATLRVLATGSRADFEAMNSAISATDLHPVIARVFPFEQAAGAFHYYDRARPFGKVVISHDD